MSIADFRDRVSGRDLTSDKSVDLYCSWADRFLEWHPDTEPITEASLRDFDTALENPSELHWTDREEPYAYNTRVQALSAAKKWALLMEDADIRTDVDVLVRGSEDDFDPTILSREEVQALLQEECDIAGCRAARTVGYDAIMRGAEVVAMKPDDVDVDDRTVYVRGKKGSENRHIGVDPRTISLLAEQRERVEIRFNRPTKLFYNSTGHRGWSSNAWTKHFKRNHHEAGFHDYSRHTAIVHRLEDGEDFWDVFLRARHQHVPMTARYASIAGRTTPSSMEGY